MPVFLICLLLQLWQATIHSFLQPPVSPDKSLHQAIHLMLPIQTDSPRFHQHFNKLNLHVSIRALTNTF